MKNTITKGEIRHELAKAKKELKDAWINGEGYEYDQNFIVCYKDGTVLETREANERLPQTGIIGIQFFGTDAHYTVGYEMYNGEKVLIEDESEDACYRVEYLPLTSTEATAETVESVETKEKITMTKAEKIFETLTEDCETFIKEHTDFENTLTFSHRYFDEYNACVRTYNAVLKLVEKRYKDIVRKIKLGVWTTEDAHLPVLVNDAVKRTVEDAKMMEQKFQKELKEIHATFEETEENDEVTTVDSVEETTVSETVEETAEQETELNAEVEAEQTAENKTETTAENITVSGTNQDNINVLIVVDIANTFETITHTGYFDTS